MEGNGLNDKDREILKLLFDEWKFRLAQFWPLMAKFYLLSLILMLLPVMHSAWGANLGVLAIPAQVLPVLGIILSAIICGYAYIELKKADKIKAHLKVVITSHSSMFAGAFLEKDERHQKIPFVIFALQCLLAMLIIFFTSQEFQCIYCAMPD